MKLKLLNIIKNHPNNYRDILTAKPYCLSIREDDEYILFRYNQINSDFSNKAVREARGIIFDKYEWDVVCLPFTKFFNHGETQAAPINWDKAKVTEKLDGSLIKIWYHKSKWHISTNGTISAYGADLQLPFTDFDGKRIDNFGDLVMHTLVHKLGSMMEVAEFLAELDKHYTHLFELCTPYNRVVVPHTECNLLYITSMCTITGTEKHFTDILLDTPIVFPLASFDECVSAAEKLPFNEEGYVVSDRKGNRVKIKSPAYLAVHRMKGGEDGVSRKRILELIRMNEHEEFLAYFAEYKDVFDEISTKYLTLAKELTCNLMDYFSEYENVDRKTLALWAIENCPIPAFIFNIADGRVKDVNEFIKNAKIDFLLSHVEKM